MKSIINYLTESIKFPPPPETKYDASKKAQDEIEALIWKTFGKDVGKKLLNELSSDIKDAYQENASKLNGKNVKWYFTKFDAKAKLSPYKDTWYYVIGAVLTDGEKSIPVNIIHYVDKDGNPN